MFFLSFPFACELDIERWRIEVVDSQVGDLVFLFVDMPTEVITIVISDFINRNIFSCPIMCI